MVSLLLTFNKYTPSGNLSFSIHLFYDSKYNYSEWMQACIRTFKKKQTKNERRKENHRKTTNYFIMQYKRFCNVGCAISWYHAAIKKWSEKLVFVTGPKAKKYSVFGTNNYSKIRIYTVLNILSGECNFEISVLRYCKRLS